MLEFDEPTHTYRLDGRIVPSVTRLLDSARLIDLSGIPPETLERKRLIGSAVHKACELDDLGVLDESSIAPVIEPYFSAYRKFKRETGFVPLLIEHRVAHPALGYAGTLDRTGLVLDVPEQIDLKTTSALSPAVGVQTAAYEAALYSDPSYDGPRNLGRKALQLRNDGTYRLETYKDPRDFAVFAALATVYHWKEKNNVR
ncbi:hypothetical protein [Paraburkholderia kururiensis]|uniref:hypothetical protein n=1 Tax=Paraburkholderia kururiensis TaxID=984307 RepID=UPI0005A5F8F2|nr:hypothetical protein [Paraburkholderia kururiensis]